MQSFRVEGLLEAGKRLESKIDSVSYHSGFFAYLLVEELLLQTDAPGVLVDIRGAAGEHVDSNLLDIERGPLLQAFAARRGNDGTTGGSRPAESDAACPLTVLDLPVTDIANGNLKRVNAELRFTAAAERLRATVVFWFSIDDAVAGARKRLEAELDRVAGQFTSALRDLAERGLKKPDDAAEDDDASLANSAAARTFMQEKDDFFARASHLEMRAFVQAYSDRFRPLELITRRVAAAIRHDLEADQSRSPLIFSFRGFGEDGISFYLTSAQLKALLGAPVDPLSIPDIQHLLQFPFTEAVGLSGYVLATGHSDFTPEPKSDERWRTDTSGQARPLQLIDRMYRILGGGSEVAGNVNVFLLPLFVRREMGPGAAGRNVIHLMVECSLPQDEDSRRRIRGDLIDIQWKYMPLVETAILAQQQTQFQADADLMRYITAHAWTLGHNFPKFLSTPIRNIAKELQIISGSLKDELMPQLTESQEQKLLRIRDMVRYLPFMAEHYRQFFAFFVGSIPGPRSSRRVVVEVKDRFDVAEFRQQLKEFVLHYREMLAETTRSVEDGSPCPEYRLMRLKFNVTGIDSSTQIRFNQALTLELLINHIANSMDELARGSGRLIKSDESRAEILVGVALETSAWPEVAFLVIRIADHGPGMPRDAMAEIQARLDNVLVRGEAPTLHSGISRKAEHTGSGFLINAHILQSFGNSAVGEPGEMRLEPTVPADVAAPGLTVILKVPVRIAAGSSSRAADAGVQRV